MNINNLHVNIAKRDVKRAGKYIQYSSVTQGVYDRETRIISNTETKTTFKAFQTAAQREDTSDPSLINKEFSIFIVSGESFGTQPNEGDKITYLLEYPSVAPLDWNDYFDAQPSSNKVTSELFRSRPMYAGGNLALWRLVCLTN